MIPLIENQITITRALFYEGMKASESAAYRKVIRTTAIVVLILFAGISIGMLLMGSSPVFLLGEFLFVGVLMLWMTVLLPNSRKKNKYKMLCKSSPDVPKRTAKFFPNHFSVVTDTGKMKDFEYKNIRNFHETKHLYVMIDESKTAILLDKKGFTIGNIEQVKKLLPKKCLQ